MTTAYLSLGSNVRPEANLRLGVRELARRYGDLIVSPTYRNEAFGFSGADFLNLVLRCDAKSSLTALRHDLEEIHALAGRSRNAKQADRTLDIDVLMYGRQIVETSAIELPRPDILRYSFVLKPLADIAPEETHPRTGMSFAEHWAAWPQDEHPLTRVALDFGIRGGR